MDDSTFPDLATVLDAGAFPADDDGLRSTLAEALVDLATYPDLERLVELRRTHVELRRDLAWATELLENPQLAERIFDQYDVVFRLDVEQTVDRARRSHPIHVGRRYECPDAGERWKCENCGVGHTNDQPAFVVGDRPGFSDLPYPITYCVPCVQMAVAALETVR
ncbi:hypothetical protein [Dermatobacter hominis]|uniref:hypothetical protein n=1 Tax=Dermatobacter hominis TaxID=2884263 RepID=UPI001D10B6A8|nr:hypothetical protein [Dermatobacter hominis]UDY35695.1 hypothetical protein LH044_20510 [Dermatobacter hominis]